MNYKTIISFIAVMIFSVSLYFVISNYQDKSLYNYDEYHFYSVTELKNITPYKPKTNNSFNRLSNDLPIIIDNSNYSYQQPSVIHPYSINESTEKNNFGHINNILKSGYTTQEKRGMQPTEGSGGGSIAFLSRGKSLGGETNSATYNSQIAANIENVGLFQSNPSGFQGQFSPNQNGGIGLPDPGGYNDIVFIPVPDGLWILIFFLTLYALWKILFHKNFRLKLSNRNIDLKD